MGSLAGKTEHDPIEDGEFVLRRIHKTMYRSGKVVPVSSSNLEPHPRDVDGLSLYREQFISIEELANWGQKGGQYYVARVSVGTLRGCDFGLHVEPSVDMDATALRGHCVITELSVNSFLANEQLGRERCRALAKLFSQNIVFVPHGCNL